MEPKIDERKESITVCGEDWLKLDEVKISPKNIEKQYLL